MNQSIFEKVSELLVKQGNVTNKEDVTPSLRLKDDLAMDSLDNVEMIMEVESEFGITIPDDEAEQVVTVSDMVDLIEKTKKK